MELDTKTLRMLVRVALLTRDYAYAPYSQFHVGAALLTAKGRIYTGCNIENAGYSATNCAERTAFFKAVSESEREFAAIAIAGGKKDEPADYTPPCGICRQVMAEFCGPEFPVILVRSEEEYQIYTLAELYPMGFSPKNLE
ncbi:MAG: cytidine deaminase [Lachnospiraceae bacterium]|nr:cytidine deaminase [Lachnospiraceae bacterium]